MAGHNTIPFEETRIEKSKQDLIRWLELRPLADRNLADSFALAGDIELAASASASAD